MFVVTLQLAIIVLLGVPLLALTQPFIPQVPGAIALAVLLATLAIAFWRRATNLQGHVRAGAQMIVEALAKKSPEPEKPRAELSKRIDELLPGLGSPMMVQLDGQSPALGQNLMRLNLRGITGATVLAIARENGEAVVPVGSETLRAGDVLVLAGTLEAVDAARSVLGAHPYL
jgi:CPA2 family monovalent cation:H+ antiporter-2